MSKKKILKVEFHCHTIYSKDSLNWLERLLPAAKKRGIDRLIITDHNSIEGALEARKIDPDRIIIGEEILTTRGELLASFVQEEIPAGLEPKEAIHRLREQGAFISVSHPFDRVRHGWALDDLLEITPLVDAIEVFNARCRSDRLNDLSKNYAKEHHLAGTVGSDAHVPFEVGRAVLNLPYFYDADSLRKVIYKGKAEVHLSSPLIHLTSWFAKLYKRAIRPKR
jgi:predicted metal-dependent phosphoesterase TrpH